MSESILKQLDEQETQNDVINISEIKKALNNGFFDKEENIVSLKHELETDQEGIKGLAV